MAGPDEGTPGITNEGSGAPPPPLPPGQNGVGPDDGTSYYQVKRTLNEHFGMNFNNVDPELERTLKGAQVRNTNGKLYLDLPDWEDGDKEKHRGHTLQINGDTISMLKGGTLDAQDARVMVQMAQSKGWTEIKVSGSDQEKSMMWMEAQRHGISVIGYKPDEQTQQMWEREKASRARVDRHDGDAPGVRTGANGGGQAGPDQAEQDAQAFQKTSALLEQRIRDEKDPAVKQTLQTVRDKFENEFQHASDGQREKFNALATALNDKDPVAGLNRAVDIIKADDPSAAVSRIAVSPPTTVVPTNRGPSAAAPT